VDKSAAGMLGGVAIIECCCDGGGVSNISAAGTGREVLQRNLPERDTDCKEPGGCCRSTGATHGCIIVASSFS